MKEVGMINGRIDVVLTRQGPMDLMMVEVAGNWTYRTEVDDETSGDDQTRSH